MRTLMEIIEDAKDGIMPTHEECYYGMLAYNAMFIMDHNKLQNELLSEKESPKFIKELFAKNSFDMLKGAYGKAPKEWLGANHDPMNSECQQQRKVHQKILDQFIQDNPTLHHWFGAVLGVGEEEAQWTIRRF